MNNQDSNLNALFNRYWQDYQQNRPIGGGVAYESKLRQCTLDGSLDSLKELDTFLTSIRSDLQHKFAQLGKSLSPQEKQNLAFKQDKFRALILFIGCYTGVVLAKAHQARPQFLNQAQLQQLDSNFVHDDFVYSMAVAYVAEDQQASIATRLSPQVANIRKPWLFFVFEPIAMRLFGSFDYQVLSIQGQAQVVDGLYRAVSERLPTKSIVTEAIVTKPVTTNAIKPVVNNPQPTVSPVSKPSIPKQAPQEIAKQPIKNQPKQPPQQTTDDYLQLLTELESIPVEQSQAVELYQKAKNVMQKLDNFAQQQSKAPSEIQLNESQTKICRQALQIMKQSAIAGNTTAMLHFAVYLMRGDWLVENKAEGITLIQNASNAQDPRAMRLLSKLYYKGEEGIAQDAKLGEYWLEQASNAGHPEAIQVKQQIQMAQMMISERKQEEKSDKIYLYLFIGLAVLVLLIMIFV